MSDQIATRSEVSLDSLAARLGQIDQSLGAIADRLVRLEQNAAVIREQVSESRELAQADIRKMESQLKEHSAAIESSQTAVAQTDELVERVVEALETLQSTVQERSEAGCASVS